MQTKLSSEFEKAPLESSHRSESEKKLCKFHTNIFPNQKKKSISNFKPVKGEEEPEPYEKEFEFDKDIDDEEDDLNSNRLNNILSGHLSDNKTKDNLPQKISKFENFSDINSVITERSNIKNRSSNCNNINMNIKNNNFLTENTFSESQTDFNSLRNRIISRDNLSTLNSIEKKLKYMLECSYHLNENAHFYCFNCKQSFCSLCIGSHSTHEYVDKYDYSKSNKNIVNNIINNFYSNLNGLCKLNRKKSGKIKGSIGNNNINSNNNSNEGIEGNKNYFIQWLIDKHKIEQLNNNSSMNNAKMKIESCSNSPMKANINDEKCKTTINSLLKELMDCYDQYLFQRNNAFNAKMKDKFQEFKENLRKFKLICINNLAHNTKISKENDINDNSGSNSDVIFLDDEYFQNLYETIKELSRGQEALIKNVKIKNEELNNELNEYNEFDKEIINDIQAIINKLKNKYSNKINSGSNYSKDYNNICLTESSEVIYETENNLLEENTIKLEKESNDVEKINNISTLNINTNNITNDFSSYIMKRRLKREIIIYNSQNKSFTLQKKFKIKGDDSSKFKKFASFSVYLNINNTLYVSGGKTKEGEILSVFYSFSPLNNTLVVLPNMINKRCSHSLIYINNDYIINEIFAIGGYNNNTCERFSFTTNTWKSLPKLNSTEKQVSTLFVVNNKFLYNLFGFISLDEDSSINNNNISCTVNKNKKFDYDYAEKLNLSNLKCWEKIIIKNNFGIDIKIYNVGIIPVNDNEFLCVGGEYYKEGESDGVMKVKINNKDISVEMVNDVKLPIKCSFIDKQFVLFKEGKYGQFEMKKNNFIVYNVNKNSFKIKSY